MEYSKEAEQVLKRIEANCELLWSGYHERVDYVVAVAYHRAECPHHGGPSRPMSMTPGYDCDCPMVDEKRTRKLRRKGYLSQLKEFAENKDTDRNPKAERGAPRVKTAGRPPGDLGGFFALDELSCDVIAVVDRVMEEVGRDRTWAANPVWEVLRGLSSQVGHFIESRPDQAREIDKAAARWVASARSTLRVSTSEAVFDSVVCGNCGGALGTPWGNESDVRCVGSPAEPPCGHTYPMSEWVRLYEDHKRMRAA